MNKLLEMQLLDPVPIEEEDLIEISEEELLEREFAYLKTLDLPEDDGEPLETLWHRHQINLSIDTVKQRWPHRRDFLVGGNMFIYYSLQQVRNKDYKGPDVFVIKNVSPEPLRTKWVAWEEDGRLPDLIIELMSASTKRTDLTTKKDLYEKVFHTSEYFCYDPDKLVLRGWRLTDGVYKDIRPNPTGQLWSEELEAWMGIWRGRYLDDDHVWLRLFDTNGVLIPTEAEAAQQQAIAAQQQAESERQRAETAEAEIARLKDELASLKRSM